MKIKYRQEYYKSVLVLTPILILIGIIFNWLNTPETITIYAKTVVEPTMAPVAPIATITPIPTDIVGYINYKFGDHAGEALKLLECENRALSPTARNDNRERGGVGVDRGYWQINNVYHPHVSDWCASDVKCSTDYAYRMWMNDGKSFVRWTCGR
jgi:hypothetical protein